MNKASSHFATGHLKSDLKRRTVRGATATIVGQGIKFTLQLTSTIVLARLLAPEDFGLVAMVMVITGFLYMFMNMGLSDATVQKDEVDHRQVSTLFWINVVLGLLLMMSLMALAPAVAWLYQEPRLMWVTIALALGALIGGLTVQHQALLRRQMKFGVLVTIDVLSMSVGIVAALLGVWLNLGYWSLVLMQLATAITVSLGVWMGSGWWPGLPERGTGIRSMLVFGGYRSYSNVVAYFTRNIDKVALGIAYGPHVTGLYTKAFSLLLLPAQQIATPMMSVMMPVLSRLQHDPVEYRNYYLKSITMLAYASMPVAAAMAALSTQIVLLVLGDQWFRAAIIFKILAFVAFWLPLIQSVIWVYLSLGRTRKMAVWFTIASPITILAFLLGLPWEAEGVATGYVAVTGLLLYPLFAFCLKDTPVHVRDVVSAVYRPFVLSLLIYLGMEMTQNHLREEGLVLSLLAGMLAGSAIVLLSLSVSSSLRADLFRHSRIVRESLGLHRRQS
jgi:PST family polysaccharide transporter